MFPPQLLPLSPVLPSLVGLRCRVQGARGCSRAGRAAPSPTRDTVARHSSEKSRASLLRGSATAQVTKVYMQLLGQGGRPRQGFSLLVSHSFFTAAWSHIPQLHLEHRQSNQGWGKRLQSLMAHPEPGHPLPCVGSGACWAPL